MKEKWCITSPRQEADEWNSMLKVSPWSGHRNFVYDLLNFMEPKKIIELGTHYGCSFFSMCQSIKDNQLNTEIFAVDTWQGDEQAGLYGEEVWNQVNETKEKAYAEVNSKFLRMYFDEAGELFDNETFDLIHIDGLHTYEAVSHDFSVWLPKLKENGIILFHDIHSYLNYGSDEFWKELQGKYNKNFEFTHSWGLGILFPKGDFWYREFLKQNFEDKIKLYEYKAISERKTIEVEDLTAMANERYEAIQKQSQMIEERNATIEAQAKMCEERYEVMQEQGKLIADKDAVIQEQVKMLAQKDTSIQEQAKILTDKDAAIAELQELKEEYQKQVEEKRNEISDLTVMVMERYKAIQEQSRMIEERDATIKAQAEMCEERYTVMQEQGKLIAEKDTAIAEQIKQINELKFRIRKNTNWKHKNNKKAIKNMKNRSEGNK